MELLFVQKNETVASIARRLDLATLLGHREILLLFTKHEKENLVLLQELAKKQFTPAVLITDQNEAKKVARHYPAIVAPARRQFFETKAVTHILEPENGSRSDFTHHRNSGLNQVLLKLCKEKKKAIVTTITLLRGEQRTIFLGRMMQNARWCKKFSVQYHITSGARILWEGRSAFDLAALARECTKT